MENELGHRLFTRNKREVALTPAGRVLKNRLEGVTHDILNAIQAAHIAQTGVTGSLCLGFLEWGTIVFMNQLENFIEQNPQITVEVYRQPFYELRTNISTNRMDLIFTMSYDCDQLSTDEYNLLQLQKVPLVAYMSKNHHLAKKEMLEAEDLRAEPLLMVDEKSSPGYGNLVRRLLLEHDIRPLVAQYAHDGGAHIGSILINKGILLASQYFLENSWTDQIARPPINGADIYVTAIWKKQNASPVLKNLMKTIPESFSA
jgi:DNA-binding transcriptional LysR family regulator